MMFLKNMKDITKDSKPPNDSNCDIKTGQTSLVILPN